MIYLNTYNESNESNEFYTDITHDASALSNLVNSPSEIFTESEKSILSKYGSADKRLNTSKSTYGIVDNGVIIYIHKHFDEYFLVSFGAYIYKCDQFEGVIKFLQDRLKLKLNESKDEERLYYTTEPHYGTKNIKFNKIEYAQVNSLFSNFKREWDNKYLGYVILTPLKPIYNIDVISITKLEDEYFYVRVFIKSHKSLHFKCDSIDGIRQLFNDITSKTFTTNESYEFPTHKEDYYYTISEEEYHSRFKKRLKFTESEIDKIEESLEEPGFDITSDRYNQVVVFEPYTSYEDHEVNHLFIYKADDEWFIITDRAEMFIKCDQIDGLTEFIKDYIKYEVYS